jgi:hypothetical protein
LAYDESLVPHEARGERRCFATTRAVWHGSTQGAHRRQVAELNTFPSLDGRNRAGLQNFIDASRLVSQSILEILKTITIVIVFKISKMDCDTDT